MTDQIHQQRILILDFGSQYSQLIARRVREIGVYCELHPYDVADSVIKAFKPKGVILSGGPETVTAETTPRIPQLIFDLGVPVLGIWCFFGNTNIMHMTFTHTRIGNSHKLRVGAQCIDVFRACVSHCRS